MLFQVPETELKSDASEGNTQNVSPETKTPPASSEKDIPTSKADVYAAQFPDLKHRVLILIDNPRKEYLEGEQRILLDNILKSIGLAIDQVDVINISFLDNNDANILFTQRKINYLITFGVPLIRLKIDLLLPPYMPEQVEGIWLLLVDSLSKVEEDREIKKKLWQALKRMFNN